MKVKDLTNEIVLNDEEMSAMFRKPQIKGGLKTVTLIKKEIIPKYLQKKARLAKTNRQKFSVYNQINKKKYFVVDRLKVRIGNFLRKEKIDNKNYFIYECV